MAQLSTEVNEDGSASVSITHDEPVQVRQTDGSYAPAKDAAGNVILQSTTWSTSRLDQTERHEATWTARPEMTRGDASALADQVNEVRKQLES